jgi:hypothetical protein
LKREKYFLELKKRDCSTPIKVNQNPVKQYPVTKDISSKLVLKDKIKTSRLSAKMNKQENEIIADTVFQENSCKKFFNTKQQYQLFNQSALKITGPTKLDKTNKPPPVNEAKTLINTKLSNTNFNNYNEITKYLADNRKKREKILSTGYVASIATRKPVTYENMKKKINSIQHPSYAW